MSFKEILQACGFGVWASWVSLTLWSINSRLSRIEGRLYNGKRRKA